MYNTMHTQLPLPERPQHDPAGYETGRMQLPFSGTSAYKEQFVAHDMGASLRSPTHHQTAQQQQPSPPFDGTTTNREMYKPYPIITRPCERPTTPQGLKHLASMPFQGVSESKEAFRAWPIDTTTRPKVNLSQRYNT
jgi:hypothetical protein